MVKKKIHPGKIIKAEKALKQVEDHLRFWVNQGAVIAKLEDLPGAIKEMPKEVFQSHVNEEKNDFANWVEHVLEDKELGDDLRTNKSKVKHHKAIKKKVKEHQNYIG